MSTRILVVDDDASLAEMIGIMLESESHAYVGTDMHRSGITNLTFK